MLLLFLFHCHVLLVEDVFQLSPPNLGERVPATKYRGMLFVFIQMLPQDATEFIPEHYEFFDIILVDFILLFFLLD